MVAFAPVTRWHRRWTGPSRLARRWMPAWKWLAGTLGAIILVLPVLLTACGTSEPTTATLTATTAAVTATATATPTVTATVTPTAPPGTDAPSPEGSVGEASSVCGEAIALAEAHSDRSREIGRRDWAVDIVSCVSQDEYEGTSLSGVLSYQGERYQFGGYSYGALASLTGVSYADVSLSWSMTDLEIALLYDPEQGQPILRFSGDNTPTSVSSGTDAPPPEASGIEDSWACNEAIVLAEAHSDRSRAIGAGHDAVDIVSCVSRAEHEGTSFSGFLSYQREIYQFQGSINGEISLSWIVPDRDLNIELRYDSWTRQPTMYLSGIDTPTPSTTHGVFTCSPVIEDRAEKYIVDWMEQKDLVDYRYTGWIGQGEPDAVTSVSVLFQVLSADGDVQSWIMDVELRVSNCEVLSIGAPQCDDPQCD